MPFSFSSSAITFENKSVYFYSILILSAILLSRSVLHTAAICFGVEIEKRSTMNPNFLSLKWEFANPVFNILLTIHAPFFEIA